MEVRPAQISTVGGDAGVLDAPTVQELLGEIHARISPEEIGDLLGALRRKADSFAAVLEAGSIGHAGPDDLRAVLRSVFATRRRVSAVLGARPHEHLRDHIAGLLYGDAPLHERFDRFCAGVDGLGELQAAELAAELLHFTDPETHALWARWVWNPATRTGALPLLVSEDCDLEADGPGATYARVADAISALDASNEAASFRRDGSGSLGTDVFLVGAYSVYMTTVLGLKMTKEFNAIVPPLPDLARRLLGVHGMEVPA